MVDAQSFTLQMMVVDKWVTKPLHPKLYPKVPHDTEHVKVFSPGQTPDGIIAYIDAPRQASIDERTFLKAALTNGLQRVKELPRVIHCRDVIGTAHVRSIFVGNTAAAGIFSRCVPRTCLDMPVKVQQRDGVGGAATAEIFVPAPCDLFAFERSHSKSVPPRAPGQHPGYVAASYAALMQPPLI